MSEKTYAPLSVSLLKHENMDIFLVEPLASRFSKKVVCSAEVAFRHFDLLVNEENEAIFCFIIFQNMCPVKPPNALVQLF